MDNWPLHVTLADVFAMDDINALDNAISSAIEDIRPFDVSVLDDAVLGETPVKLLDKSATILDLHERVVDALDQLRTVFNTPAFTRAGFLPHITQSTTGLVEQESQVSISSLSLIDMFPGDDWQQRKVLATWPLSTR